MCTCDKSTGADKTLLVLAIITIVISSITLFYSFFFAVVIAAFCGINGGFGCSGIPIALTCLSGAMLCAGILEVTAGAGVCCCAPYSKGSRQVSLAIASFFRVITLGLGIWLIVFVIGSTVTPWYNYDTPPPGSEGTTLCYFNACEEFTPGSPDDDCCGFDGSTFCAEGYTHMKVRYDWQYATWVNAPEGFLSPENRCSTDAPYSGNTCCTPNDVRDAYGERSVDGGAWFGIALLLLLWCKIAATLCINICIFRRLNHSAAPTGPAALGTEMGAFTSTAAPRPVAVPTAVPTAVPIHTPMAVATGTPIAYASK